MERIKIILHPKHWEYLRKLWGLSKREMNKHYWKSIKLKEESCQEM